MGNVTWGSGVNGNALLTNLKSDYDFFDSCTSAADVANALAGKDDNCEEAKALANAAAKNLTEEKTPIGNTSTTVTLADGYYLLVDTSAVTGEGAVDARNSALLQVTEDISITKKYTVPSVEKKVKDTNDSTGETSDWQDSADHNIGDTIEFQLTGTLPSNYDDYDSYKYEFQDTMSEGLDLAFTSEEGVTPVIYDVTVKIDDTLITSGYSVTYENHVLKVTFADLKDLTSVTATSKIVVEYKATLNANATVGEVGNPNTVKVVYSNDPNATGDGTTGTTPTDTTTVFTYKLVVNKTDGANALDGAGFTLYKQTGTTTNDEGESIPTWTAIGSEIKTGSTFTWTGLDDGNYMLVESTTPAGYNTAADLYFTITAEHEILSDDPQLNSLSGGNVVTGEVSTGTLTTVVVNNQGSTLPETGGMGTTIFYIVGGIMVVAAVVLLVTKKRMSTEG